MVGLGRGYIVGVRDVVVEGMGGGGLWIGFIIGVRWGGIMMMVGMGLVEGVG